LRTAAFIAIALAGILLGATFTASGRGKAPEGKTWQIASVDEGSIEHQFYTDDLTTAADKTRAEVTKRTNELLSQGYEPYAASVYNNGIYSNMRVWFFRKSQ